jgi:hypothetical protein
MHEDPALRNLPPRPETLAARHEVEDLALGGIKASVFLLALLIVGTFIVVWLVFRVLLHVAVSFDDGTPSPFAKVDHPVTPGPQIQPSRDHNTLDWQDLAAFKDDEHRKLTEYAWIGPDKQKARIPIDKAMDILLAQGLPTRSATASGGPAGLPVYGGAGGLMVAPANPLTLPPGNETPGNRTETPP